MDLCLDIVRVLLEEGIVRIGGLRELAGSLQSVRAGESRWCGTSLGALRCHGRDGQARTQREDQGVALTMRPV